MPDHSITAANAIIMLTVIPLYPVPQQLVGFAAEDVYDTEEVEVAELVMGVDGRMSAGFINYMTPQSYMIMPDSPTSLLFETWIAAEKAIQEKLWASGTIALPATGRKYAMTRGVISRSTPLPNAKKVLQARRFTITWGGIDPAQF